MSKPGSYTLTQKLKRAALQGLSDTAAVLYITLYCVPGLTLALIAGQQIHAAAPVHAEVWTALLIIISVVISLAIASRSKTVQAKIKQIYTPMN